jgi:HK97 family phage prohead protease
MDISRRGWLARMDTSDEGRTISGVAVPFNSPTQIAERGRVFEERFAPGAFAKTLAERGPNIPILLHHDGRSLPVGKLTGNRSSNDGLHIDARISDTADGNDVLTLVNDGVLDGLSIGFESIRDEWSQDFSQRVVHEAKLHELSIVNFPAYDKARIAAVRAATIEEIEAVEHEAPATPRVVSLLLELHERRQMV